MYKQYYCSFYINIIIIFTSPIALDFKPSRLNQHLKYKFAIAGIYSNK